MLVFLSYVVALVGLFRIFSPLLLVLLWDGAAGLPSLLLQQRQPSALPGHYIRSLS